MANSTIGIVAATIPTCLRRLAALAEVFWPIMNPLNSNDPKSDCRLPLVAGPVMTMVMLIEL